MIFVLMMTLMDPDELMIADRNYWLALLTLVVLFLTLVAIIIYTYYTKQVQGSIVKQIEVGNEQVKAANRQIEKIEQQTAAIRCQTKELIHQRKLSIIPAIFVEFPYVQDTSARHCLIKNVGHGPAVNFAIDRIKVLPPPNSTREEFGPFAKIVYDSRIEFERLLFLAPGVRQLNFGKERGKLPVSSKQSGGYPLWNLRFAL